MELCPVSLYPALERVLNFIFLMNDMLGSSRNDFMIKMLITQITFTVLDGPPYKRLNVW